MRVLLTTIETVFEMPTRGHYASLRPWKSEVKVCAKDEIQLRTPDGRVLDTQVRSMELVTRADGTFLAIGLPSGIKKSDVPEGTEVWIAKQM